MNSKQLIFSKCFFCSKNFNQNDLIDMNINTILINNENVEFKNLIFDVCNINIDETQSNSVCTECNNNLVLFHMFKRDAKKYKNFHSYIEKLKILSKLETFLDSINEDYADLTVFEESKKNWMIYINREKCHFDLQEEEIIEYDPEDINDQMTEYDESQEHYDDNNEEVSSVDFEVTSLEDNQDTKIKDLQKNDCISESQLKWIEEEVKQSEVKVKGENDNFYKCSICDIKLSSPASLTRHLRDIHILIDNNADRKMEKKQRDYLEIEMLNSKINIMTLMGPQVVWKCRRQKDCDKEKVYKSEQGFQLHLRSKHIDDIIFESMKSIKNPILSTWQCGHCSKKYNSQDNINNHLNKDHFQANDTSKTFQLDETNQSLTKKRKLNTLNDLKQEQLEWIRTQVKISEVIKGKKKTFKCSVCSIQLGTQASLIRHLRDLHILKELNNERVFIKEEVENSKTVIDTLRGEEVILKCHHCNRFYKSEQAFKLHLRMNHIRTTNVSTAFIASCKTSIINDEGVVDVWKCQDCKRFFRHRDGLRNHIKIEHPNINDSELNEPLMKTFKSNKNIPSPEKNESFSKILEKLSNESVGKSENFCEECGVKFLTARHHVKPKVHNEAHQTFKTIAQHFPHYKCESCRMVFNSQISLTLHLEVHDDVGKIQIIPSEEGLVKFGAISYKNSTGDADDSCLDEAVWKCGHCNVRYFEENDCVSHQLLLHSASIFCFVDNREFSGSTALSKFIQHMKNKHPEYFPDIKYPCGCCKMEFPTIYEKLSHQKKCDKKLFQCDYCMKRYSTKHQLQSHMLFELGLSGFSCDRCGKKCKTMSDLRIHQNCHSNARPYECSICDKSFKTPGARSTHLEKHTIDGGITCEICNVKLGNRTLYQRHKRFQHNSEFRKSQYVRNTCNTCNKKFLRTSHFKQHIFKCALTQKNASQ